MINKQSLNIIKFGLLVSAAIAIAGSGIFFIQGMYPETVRAIIAGMYLIGFVLISSYIQYLVAKRVLFCIYIAETVGGRGTPLNQVVAYVRNNYSKKLDQKTIEKNINKLTNKKWVGNEIDHQSYRTMKFIGKLINVV
jgi:hypothetical protein